MKAELGTVISGTLRPEDLIPAFADELRRRRFCAWSEASINNNPELWEEIACLLEAADSADGASEDAVELVWELADALNEFAPEGAYFGAHPGDGPDFGFWMLED